MSIYSNFNIFILHCKDSRKVKFVYEIGMHGIYEIGTHSTGITVILRNRTYI